MAINENSSPETAPREEMYKNFIHSATSWCSIYDSNLKMIDINAAGLQMFPDGTREEDVIGKNLLELVPGLKETGRYDKYMDVIRTGKHFLGEMVRPHSKFGDVYLNIKAFKVDDGMGMIVTDITAQKKAEEEHLKRMRFLENMVRVNRAIRGADDLDQMLDNVLGTLLSILECDRAWLLYPCDPAAPFLHVPMERAHPNYPGAFVKGNKTPNTPDLLELEKAMLDSTEPLIIGQENGQPVPNSLKKFSVQSQVTTALYPRVDKPWIFGLHQCSHPRIWTEEDQTLFKEVSRRIAEALNGLLYLKNLQDSEKRYRALFDQAGDAIFIIDLDGTIRDANPQGCKLLDYTKEELLKRHHLECVHSSQRVDSEHKAIGLLAGEKYVSYEKELIRKSGETIPVEINVTIVSDQDGTPKYYQSIIRDITERKRMEAEKKELEEQLFQSQKMESIGRLAGGIAHDFNNILTGIMGYAELLKMRSFKPGTKEGHAVDVIIKSTTRAADLTKQLLGFARGGKYNPVPLKINDIIKDSVKVSGKIFEKNIVLTYDLTENINTIEADKHQMGQVLTNLIINARDAMPNGGNLIIKTENIFLTENYSGKFPEIQPGNYIRISITDTGTGMSKEIKKHIFEPFFTTKEEGRGTGLGLATVYGIVKSHHGHIAVYSEPGEGTTFTLYFPVSEKNIAVAVKKDIIIVRGEAVILVVDDEESVRDMAEDALDILGYKVLCAGDGSEAVTIYKEKKNEIDLVLLDMVMPIMAGKETYLELKKLNPKVKVLLVSGYSQNEKATEILEEGVLGFVQKPFGLQKLSEQISQTLNIQ
ncbi:MAG: PAS domain S-box protein [bacterium]|nr:PAS domain S-box protein [bacterium]